MRRAITPTLLVLALPAVVLAWGGEGHQVICLIAENHLTPEAQAAVHELLDGADISDAEICNWADQIRGKRLRTSPWHYVNIPLDAEGYDAKRDDPSGNHVVTRIEKFEALLSDKSQTKEARAEALKFLVHFIGDLHQPLHTTQRNGDRGGNELKVRFLGKSKNLHEVWDTFLLREYIGEQRIADYADALNGRFGPEIQNAWRKGMAADWTTQAWRIARDTVYSDVPADGGTELGTEYVDRNCAIVELQLQRAGIRLAEVLNRALVD